MSEGYQHIMIKTPLQPGNGCIVGLLRDKIRSPFSTRKTGRNWGNVQPEDILEILYYKLF